MSKAQIKQDEILDNYVCWLRGNMSTRLLENGVVEVTVPFLNHLNDHLQLYISQNPDGSFELSDDGQTVFELELQGVSINSAKRKAQLSYICRTRGVKLSSTNALTMRTGAAQLAQAKHMLVQTMQAVSGMSVLSRSNIQSLFVEDVNNFLENHDIPYSRDLQVLGQSGFLHHIDFVIPKTKKRPEILMNVTNKIDKQSSKLDLFSIGEIKQSRHNEFVPVVFFDDINGTKSETAVDAYRSYGVSVLNWSNKVEALQFLGNAA